MKQTYRYTIKLMLQLENAGGIFYSNPDGYLTAVNPLITYDDGSEDEFTRELSESLVRLDEAKKNTKRLLTIAAQKVGMELK